jgi:hypothetical protein
VFFSLDAAKIERWITDLASVSKGPDHDAATARLEDDGMLPTACSQPGDSDDTLGGHGTTE